MPQDPFPSPGVDGEDPDGPVPPPAAENAQDVGEPDYPAPPPPAAGQGLFVCLPAEDLDVARFAQHGQSDSMPPGPLLASVVDALTGEDGEGLAALSDDQLVGVIAAARRLESRIAWTQLAALAEFAARRPADPAGRDGGRPSPASACEFAADELAAELRLTWQSAAGQIDYACAVAGRLPCTLAALAAGTIHPVHARIIEDETSVLSAQDAAGADQVLAEAAASRTFGQLRAHAHRVVLKLDPDAARKRKEAARREAHVRRFREGSGNAGMVARELPPDEVLASWQHVEQRALDLRAAGVPGTLQELRVRAYLDLLQERDSRTAPAARAAPDAVGQAAPPGHGGMPGSSGDPGGSGGPSGPGAPGGPAVAALVNITVPLSTLAGLSGTPGEAAGFGLLDAQDTRDLVTAAARHPDTRWCLTVLHPDGTAAAHGCAAGRRVTRRLSDNDMSASNGKPRPGFGEVMRLADERQADVIVVWAVDRLVRRLADREDVIERCEKSGVKLATVSGDLDLSTDQGRLVGRILASVARGEVERKGTRQRAANSQAAKAGKRRRGCPRPFGYQADHVTPEPAEGPAIAAAVALINAGGSISAVMREWQRDGLVPPQSAGGRWTRSSVRAVLLNPAIAGLSAYRGEIVADGTWMPLVTREAWEACRAILQDPARKPPRGVKTLLGGIALCPCGAPALGSVNHLGTHVYRCAPQNRAPGSGPHVARVAADIDHLVTELVIARLSAPDAVNLLPQHKHVDVAALSSEANAIRVRRDELGALFADGEITRAVLLAGTERAEARLAEIGRKLAEAASDSAVAPLIGAADVRKAWNALDLSRQRAVIHALVTVTLLSPGRGRRDFDPDSVRIEWAAP